MKAPGDRLADLRSQVAESLDAIARDHLLHDADDADLAAAVAVAGDLARLVEGILIEGAAELAHRSRATRQGSAVRRP